MNLDRLQKIAIARLLSDLIEADFVVEQNEMYFFENIISKDGLSIRASMLIEAKKMDLAKALSILKELSLEDREEVVEVLKSMSMSDGACVPLEAIQIFAIEQVLLHNAAVYSVPLGNFKVENLTVLYIENEDETVVNSLMEDSYRSICNEFNLSGFEFVHIPHVVSDFRQMDEDYLKKVLKYMIPSISSSKIDEICTDLCGLTTSRFCRELLYKKIGLDLLDARPSLLIKVSESIIVDYYSTDEAERTDYGNFIRIELGDNVLHQITSLLEAYHSMVNSTIMVESKPRLSKFIYCGFHRSLFDLIAYGREQKAYKLIFDLSRQPVSVYFEPKDGGNERIPLKLSPQEIALYVFITKKSLVGEGLDWREQMPSEEKHALLEEYNRIYRYVGKGNDSTEYKDRTLTNHIKNKIRVLQCISNSELFIPEHVRDGGKSLYRIKAKEPDVEIKEHIRL